MFYREKHIKYIASLDNHKQDYEYWLSEHLRLNGVYWGLTALFTLKAEDTFNKAEVLKFVMSCWDDKNGGFGVFPRHDAHLHATLSALQILTMYKSMDILGEKKQRVTNFIKSMQLKDGSFQGDKFGEIDTRFVYTAVQALTLLGELSSDIAESSTAYILKCFNFDGGFGMVPGAESHAAQVFTCVGTLALCKTLDKIDQDLCGWWLCERQLEEGGLNGRPSKLPDVCYSWWVLSSLAIMNRLDWIDGAKLRQFILDSQDPINGGIGDRPGNQVDVFHTLFGIAGLSLLGYEDLAEIDPIYCLPRSITSGF